VGRYLLCNFIKCVKSCVVLVMYCSNVIMCFLSYFLPFFLSLSLSLSLSFVNLSFFDVSNSIL
jgi:hypothetical protein